VNRRVGVLAAVTVVVILALWIVPPVGLIAAAVMAVLLPPWGRTLTERAVISGVVILGIIALVFPRAGSMPVTSTSARVLVAVLLVGMLLLNLVPRLRDVRIPRPTIADGIVLLTLLAAGWWFVSAYVGMSPVSIVSGLFFTGWDNHGHYTTFANTVVAQGTTWPTIDGSMAWNQWYPALQTTAMALAEVAWRGESLDRISLLWPFVQWNAALFAASLAILAWVAGDIAARVGGRSRESWTRPLAAALLALFALLGSPALLYNRGFTNFVLGVAVVVAVAWISARSWRSARMLGWFLIPIGLLAAVGLWTPLAIGLVPSGVIVAIALFRYRLWAGIAWLAAAIVAGGVMAVTQLSAILGADPEAGASDFAQNLGSIDVGMSTFNVGAALLAPVVAALVAILLITQRRTATAMAIAGPVLGFAFIAGAFMLIADGTDTSRLQSYYVLKPLNGTLLAVAPLIAALIAVVVVRALDGLARPARILGVATAVAIVAGAFGYAGAQPEAGTEGLDVAAGVRAGTDRSAAVANSTIGEVLIRSAEAAVPYPDDTTVLWDAGGVLQNLWVASLHTTLSKDMQTMYLSLPSDPYDAKTLAYLDLMAQLQPDQRFAVLWFAPDSEIPLTAWATGKPQVQLVRVPMPANGACPECTGT
jgi:hypothetical protein